MRIRLAALLLLLTPLLGLSFEVPTDCATRLYLLPTPGTPQPEDQVIRLIPATTATFRMRYGTNYGNMATYSTGAAAGQEITANTRGEFPMSSLSPATKYHWRVECSESGRWRRGWGGSLNTLPSSGGAIKLLVGSDAHYVGADLYDDGEGSTAPAGRTYQSFVLMAREHDAHAYLDLGDAFMIHCHTCDNTRDVTDDFGRGLGQYSITHDAVSQATEAAYAEARYSLTLRRMWLHLRYMGSIWVRGNHDAGGGYGGNDPDSNLHHWQYRLGWTTTGVDIDMESADFNEGTGVFTHVAHGIEPGAGTFRWQNLDPAETFTVPTMTGCQGGRSSSMAENEWFIEKLDVDTFKIGLAGNPVVWPYCTGGSGGVGRGTLVRSSDMRAASVAVIDKYMPQQNDVYAHGWGALGEDHIMGPVPLSDYALVLTLDPYIKSGLGTCNTDAERFPDSEREEDCGWSLGTDQHTGALATINEIQDGDGAYESVETLQMSGAYKYARGSLCETATYCAGDPLEECYADSMCSDTCERKDCSSDFAHPRMQELHAAMAAMVTRTSGIAIVLMGHDHHMSFGEKGDSGVYYMKVGQLGGQQLFPWGGGNAFQWRYDFDGDTIPAYRRHLGQHGKGANYVPWTDPNGLIERGTEYKGFSILNLLPAAESESGKTEIEVDFKVTRLGIGEPYGESPKWFPFLIQGD
jgi:hypothetical protein